MKELLRERLPGCSALWGLRGTVVRRRRRRGWGPVHEVAVLFFHLVLRSLRLSVLALMTDSASVDSVAGVCALKL
jgi:hypothetical protein